MSPAKRALLLSLSLLLAVSALLLFAGIAGPVPGGQRAAAAAITRTPIVPGDAARAGILGDRTIRLSNLVIGPPDAQGLRQVALTVTLTNTGKRAINVRAGDFALSAEGDIFAQTSAPTPSGALTGAIAPAASRAGRLSFVVPQAAVAEATLFYHASAESPEVIQQGAGAAPAVASIPLVAAAASNGNTIEDTFTRGNQTGWGTSTNNDGVPNVAWGMDGNGGRSFVTISNNTGAFGYQGNTNAIGIASAGTATYNGGDSLVEFSMSAVGHVTPYVVQNACSSKGCYYGARLHTSKGQLEITKRSGGSTHTLVSTAFVASANTLYWMRLDVSVGASTTLSAKIWADGAPEPSGWMLTTVDNTPLAANFSGTGGSWDKTGTGESINYTCYAFATSGLAAPCASGGGGTPTPTPTGTATATATATPSSTATATPTPTQGGANSIEDTFTRGNQTGWGTSTNNDGVPNVAWGMDGNGSLAYVTIGNHFGVYGYQGATNTIGIASAGTATYSSGDSLVEFAVSAVGHVTPYVVQSACSDKSCYYGARLHTSQNVLELARRSNGTTGILATIPFTAAPNTFYWMRLDVAVSGGVATVGAKVWAAGAAEPAGWMVTVSDSNPLAANLSGTGGSWDNPGGGESIDYTCYAFATTGLATACGGVQPPPTPTPAPATPSPTPVQGITEYTLSGGVGEPWGTAVDASGNVWFAEPGCDFAPTCSASAGRGQIGEYIPSTGAVRLFMLPNISGNQPIFVAFDGAGNLWFTTPNNSMIGEFSPSTQTFIGQWPVTPGSGPWDLTFSNGKLWYTEHLVSAVGRFDPVAHTFTDFPTPSANSNPYGIVASSNLIWFTENNSSVARVAALDTSNGNAISEYLIRANPPNGLTPHMIALDAQGNPWWTEGFVSALGKLVPSQATPGQCGASSGSCVGVTEYNTPPANNGCSGSHASGIAMQISGGTTTKIWLDNALTAQVGSFNPATTAYAMLSLPKCGAHPHDGLNLDAANNVWWDEEFNNALGELVQSG
ncbi:MAG: hypothetical protein OJF49_001199 [Ktedonobacterales bacterium]|jgi:streptogramin lyase|nr:MAG: hypothetical protein OJF49_001199 [Ktedonobacterales bacterium]